MTLRLAHFSDVHIGIEPARMRWRDLCSKRLLGWVNLRLLGRGAALAEAPAVARALLADLEALRPDHILFTGDATCISLPEEFEAARKVFAPLLDDPRVIGIPGNHDVYVREAERRGEFERSFGAWMRSDLERGAFPTELQSHYPFPLLRLLGEEAALIALRDVHPVFWHDSTGWVGEAQLAALEWLLERPDLRGRLRILALHYGLRRGDGSPDTCFHRLRDAGKVFEIAARKGVHLVLHGHLHGRFVHPAGKLAPFAIANPGALAHRRHRMAYHVYEIGGGSVRLEVRRFDGDAGAFARSQAEAPLALVEGAGLA
jgi:3',5'-cyclic AMP phosphodiesterase CpdA